MNEENYLNGEFVSSRFKNIAGKRFGRWKVIEFSHIRNHNAYWKCLCDCGNEKAVCGTYMRAGRSKSCGCFAREMTSKKLKGNKNVRKGYGKGCSNALFYRYKDSAKRREIEFNLDYKDFISLTSENCYYCGLEPNQVYKKKNHYGEYIYNGIDRLDNNQGYTLDNCVPCCGTCNYAKHKMSEDEFYMWIRRVVSHGMPMVI